MNGSPLRLVVLPAPLVASDLALELHAAGHAVELPESGVFGTAWLGARRDASPLDGVICINHSPEVALICSHLGVPCASWTVDPLPLERLRVLPGTDLDRVAIFLHRSALEPVFRHFGFARVAWLPLAAPARRTDGPVPSVAPHGAPCFVGSSLRDEEVLWRRALEAWALGPEVDAALERFLDTCAELAEDPAFPGFLACPSAMPKGLPEALSGRASPEAAAWSLDAGLAVRFRRRRVAALAAAGTRVHGDDGWAPLVGEAWGGALRDGRELTTAYRESRLNLDVPRLHQREIATLRAFDVLAAGGLLAAEPGSDLVRLFEPGRHFLPCRDTREALELVERAKDPPPEWEAIRLAGAREVRDRHRLGCRLEPLLAPFRELREAG